MASAITVVAAPLAEAAQPVPGHTSLAPDSVRLDTVRIENGEVTDIEVIGNRAIIAGTFTSIRNATGTAVAQRYLAAFDINTGLLDTNFRPTLPSSVEAVEASPNGQSLYIAGNFNTVNGVARRKFAKINPTTGALDTAFTANLGARATAIAVSDSWVYVGGFFNTVNNTSRGLLAAVNPTTGALDPGFNIPITQGIGSGGTLKVTQLKLTTNEDRLIVAHTGRLVGGEQRVAVAVINTGPKTLATWSTNLYSDYLPVTGGVVRVTNVDISPDNSYIVLVSGGGGDRPPVSDTAVALPLNNSTTPVDPIWVSRLFDSLYGVEITERAVYLAGHFRYMEAPTANQPWPGLDTQNYGWGESLGAGVLGPTQVVRRDMLGALDPATGTAVEWNPTAEAVLGHGHIEATPRGLFVGMDSSVIGGQAIGRFGFFDFNNIPATSPAETYIDFPYEGALADEGVLTFEGRAEAATGVNRVQMRVQNTQSGQWLQDNMTSWSNTWNDFTVAVAAPGAVESDWAYTINDFPDGSYRVFARTFSSNGTRDSTEASKRFTTQPVGNPAPDSTLSYPGFGVTVATNTFVLAGTAYDDVGVVNVSLEIRDRDTNLYLQDNGTFNGQSNSFQAELLNPNQPATQFEHEFTLPDGQYIVTVVATDNEGQVEHEGLGQFFTVAAGASTAPAVTLDSVTTGQVVAPNTRLTLSGTATDTDGTVTQVEVSVRNNQTNEGVQIDGSWGVVPSFYKVTPPNTNAASLPYSYLTPPLPIGSYTIRVRATDNNDFRTPTTAVPPSTVAQPNVALTVGTAGDALPDTTLTATVPTQNWDQLNLPISGTATDAVGVGSVRLVIYNSTTRQYLTNTAGGTSLSYSMVTVPVASPGATSTTFSTTFTLPAAGNYRATAIAVDTAGQYDSNTTGAVITSLIFPGDADPTLVEGLGTPVAGSTYTNSIPIGGRATDDVGISRVNVTVLNTATNQYLRSDGTMGAAQTLSAYLTNPGGVGSNFSYLTPTVPAGPYTVTVQSVDSVGQVMLAPYIASVTVVAG